MTLENELQQKLKDFRKSLNLNQTEFAEALKVSQGTVANIESGKREVSKPIMIKIKDVYNVDLLSYNEAKTNNETTGNVVQIKFYKDAKAAAGSGLTLPETSEEEIFNCDKRWLENIIGVKAYNAIIIQAKGNSMDSGNNNTNNNIQNGDLLLVDTSVKDVINNETFIIQQNNELRVKKLFKDFNGNIYLISNNEEYPPELVKDETTIIGMVVWNLSKKNV